MCTLLFTNKDYRTCHETQLAANNTMMGHRSSTTSQGQQWQVNDVGITEREGYLEPNNTAEVSRGLLCMCELVMSRTE